MGSASGDSQVIKLFVDTKTKKTALSVATTLVNVGSISDFTPVVSDPKGRPQLSSRPFHGCFVARNRYLQWLQEGWYVANHQTRHQRHPVGSCSDEGTCQAHLCFRGERAFRGHSRSSRYVDKNHIACMKCPCDRFFPVVFVLQWQ